MSCCLVPHLKAQKMPAHDLKFSHEIEAELATEKVYPSRAAYYYSYIGDYKKAIQTYEVPLAWGLDTVTHKDSLLFLNFHPVAAIPYILERALKEEMIIISEAHQKPQHRIFTLQLLKGLYQKGYRYLGVEAVAPSFGDSTKFTLDKELNERGYPLHSPMTGTYTREPQMGELVRTAIALGFEVFGFERTDRKIERDLAMAQNIQRFVKSRPDGKVLIHTGWYHAIESDEIKRKKDQYMAYHIKQLMGVDPFTIYQDILTEKGKDKESPYLKWVEANQPSILINQQGGLFTGPDSVDHFDCWIYHPPTTYQNGRPDWMLKNLPRLTFPLSKNWFEGLTLPCIVSATYLKEKDLATPADRIEVKDLNQIPDLILRKDIYVLKIEDVKGQTKLRLIWP